MTAPFAPPVRVGERFARRVLFDVESIRQFALMNGDRNPVHHDHSAGARSPFGRIIASGPHVVGLMMGLDASALSERCDALGLGFEFRFVKAIPAGTELSLEWRVTACYPKASLAGFIIEVEGRAVDDLGTVYTTGRGANLVRPPATAKGAP